jgi:hypothetical protein
MTGHTPRAQGQSVPERETSTPSLPDKGVLRAFTSLRQRNFRLFWFGQMISLIGSFMQIVGQSWLVLELTHSAWQLSLVGALQALPILLFSIFAGVLADRWPKRRVLLVTQSAAMIQAFLFWLLIATGTIQLWHIYVLVLLLGLMNSLGRPTYRAFIVELVGREDLPNAVALYSSLTSLRFEVYLWVRWPDDVCFFKLVEKCARYTRFKRKRACGHRTHRYTSNLKSLSV